MNNDKMFEFAVKNKLRFPFKGFVSVEDLWDLSVENLDIIFKALNSQIKQAKEESLLLAKTKSDELIEMQIKIVKYIVEDKLKQKAERELKRSQYEKKQRIMSILANKQDEELQNKSPEELEKMLSELSV